MSFSVSNMASFDDLGKVAKSAYVLEAGNYQFYLGTSVRDAQKLAFEYIVAEDTVTEQLKSWCRPFKLEKRMLADGSFENLPMGEPEYYYGKNEPTGAKAPESLVKFDDVGVKATLDEFVAQFTDDELMDFVGGKRPTGVANTGCFGGMERLDIPPVPTADGPAGLTHLWSKITSPSQAPSRKRAG